MDYEDIEETLRNDYSQWCEDNGYILNLDTMENFIDSAVSRLEEIMTGGLSAEEAYEEYKSEMYDDMNHIREECE